MPQRSIALPCFRGQEWSAEVRYSAYFDQCAPSVCTYTKDKQLSFIEGFSIVMGLLGGACALICHRAVGSSLTSMLCGAACGCGWRTGLSVSLRILVLGVCEVGVLAGYATGLTDSIRPL